MSFDLEEVQSSARIFYELLQRGAIAEEQDSELYRTYVENEQVMLLVQEMAEASESSVARYGGFLYLTPTEDNNFLGYSKKDLKHELCGSTGTDKDYYLAQFMIITLLVEFYDGQGYSARTREFLRAGELLNVVSRRLAEGVQREGEQESPDGIAYSNILEKYEALRSSDEPTRKRSTKEGFLFHILQFLERQKLITYLDQDDMILPTSKLDHLMDFDVLNQNNYQRVARALKGRADEQN